MRKCEYIFIAVLILVVISVLWYFLRLISLVIAGAIILVVLAYLLIEIATQ